MSRTNKHRTNWINSPSYNYMHKELGPRRPCPRRSCKGTCIVVLVQYQDHGPINYEHECTVCGKVIKDPRYKPDRGQRWYMNKWESKKKKYRSI